MINDETIEFMRARGVHFHAIDATLLQNDGRGWFYIRF